MRFTLDAIINLLATILNSYFVHALLLVIEQALPDIVTSDISTANFHICMCREDGCTSNQVC